MNEIILVEDAPEGVLSARAFGALHIHGGG
jgi:beta-phosphoglucomutase-like phosphatase (HAD superfamily)